MSCLSFLYTFLVLFKIVGLKGCCRLVFVGLKTSVFVRADFLAWGFLLLAWISQLDVCPLSGLTDLSSLRSDDVCFLQVLAASSWPFLSLRDSRLIWAILILLKKWHRPFVKGEYFFYIYLTDLHKLSVFFRSIPDSTIAYVFVRGLLGSVKRLILFSARVDYMSLENQLARAWAIMKDETAESKPVVAAIQPAQITRSSLGMGPSDSCYDCNGPNHFARDYAKRRKITQARCHRCNKTGHQLRNCRRNEVGDETSAPVYSPDMWTRRYLSLLSTLTAHHAWRSLTLGANGPSGAQSCVGPGRSKVWLH